MGFRDSLSEEVFVTILLFVIFALTLFIATYLFSFTDLFKKASGQDEVFFSPEGNGSNLIKCKENSDCAQGETKPFCKNENMFCVSKIPYSCVNGFCVEGIGVGSCDVCKEGCDAKSGKCVE